MSPNVKLVGRLKPKKPTVLSGRPQMDGTLGSKLPQHKVTYTCWHPSNTPLGLFTFFFKTHCNYKVPEHKADLHTGKRKSSLYKKNRCYCVSQKRIQKIAKGGVGGWGGVKRKDGSIMAKLELPKPYDFPIRCLVSQFHKKVSNIQTHTDATSPERVTNTLLQIKCAFVSFFPLPILKS